MFNKKLILTGLLFTLGGCATLNPETQKLKEQLELQNIALSNSQKTVATLSDQLQKDSPNNPLLPPNAKAGECYARVWQPPTYRTISENRLAREASEKVSIQPAVYEWQNNSIQVKEATQRRIPIQAQYGYEEQKILVSEQQRAWRINLKKQSPIVPASTLAAISDSGVNLDNAAVNSCYYEYYVAPEYQYVNENILVSEESERIVTKKPQYETVSQQILVQEASKKLIQIPAVYETISEQVLDKPAHKVWKKGVGPIQRIDESTGEIMCLVDVPATYKTITRKVLKTPATTKTVNIPAKYKTVNVRRQTDTGATQRITIPAKYKQIKKKIQTNAGHYVWLDSKDRSLPKTSRTGRKVCLVEQPARYKTVKRKVVTQAASFKVEQIPAQFKTIKVKKLVRPAKEIRTAIPAIEQTVTRQELVKQGHMQWRSILCETNMTTARLRDIQRALVARGYDPGNIDGVIGTETMSAINKFQRDQKLPVDRYLNTVTVKALGVTPQ